MEAEGAVELGGPGDDRRTEHTQVAHPAGARLATTAGRNEAQHHGITCDDVLDAGTDLDDHAGALMTADHRQLHRHVAGDQMVIGVTESARGQLDQYFVLLGSVEFYLLDFPFLVQPPPQHCGLGLHSRSPCVSALFRVSRWRAGC